MSQIAIEGTLEAMDLPTLVQFVVQEGVQTVIHLEKEAHTGQIYLDGKQLCHAELYDANQETKIVGEEVIYELLSWETGNFQVSKQVQPPAMSIQQNWDVVLMEGLRQLDEKRHHMTSEEDDSELLLDLLADMSDADAAEIKELVKQSKHKEIKMANVNQTLQAIMNIEGSVATALVDWESGMTLGTAGSGLDIDLAAAGNTNVVRSKMAVMKDLGLKGGIEDILITLTEQYHLIRILHNTATHLFLYVALDRTHANLGMARHKLAAIEQELEI